MIPKGQVKISITNATLKRLEQIRNKLSQKYPEKFDDETSMHKIIVWILDEKQFLKGNL